MIATVQRGILHKKENTYIDHTTAKKRKELDMAYNNARLIAKPESNWLSQ